MEVCGLWLPDWLVVLLCVALLLYVYGTWTFTLGMYGYKGPRPLPFVGNLFQLLPKDKHFAYIDQQLKAKYGELVALYFGRQPEIIVYSPKLLKSILVKDFTKFQNRRKNRFRGPLKYSLLDIDDGEWKRIRGLTSPFFTSTKLKQHMAHLQQTVDSLVVAVEKHVADDGSSIDSIDVKRISGDFAMESILRTAFGVSCNVVEGEDNEIIQAARKAIDVKLGFFVMLGFFFPFLIPLMETVMNVELLDKKAMAVLKRVVEQTIEQRTNSNEVHSDFMQTCLNAHESELTREATEAMGDYVDPNNRGNALTSEEIMSQALTFIFAGFDTTSTTIGFLLYLLATNQDWQDRVVEELDEVIGDKKITYDMLKQLPIMDMCLDETMRIYPAAFRVDRRVSETTTLDGHIFPKDVLVAIPIRALHMDPDLWEDPEVFNPERFAADKRKEVLNSYTYMPFGMGPRGCVGMRLALVEVKMAAATLLKNFKWTVSKKTKLPMELDSKFFPTVKGGNWLDAERR